MCVLMHRYAKFNYSVSFIRHPMSWSGFFSLWWNTMTKNNLRRKGFISAPSSTSQSLIEGNHGRNSRHEPGGRSWCWGREGTLFTDLLLIARSAWLLVAPRATCSGMVLPAVSWDLPYLSPIKKMYHRLAHRPMGKDIIPALMVTQHEPAHPETGFMAVNWFLHHRLTVKHFLPCDRHMLHPFLSYPNWSLG